MQSSRAAARGFELSVNRAAEAAHQRLAAHERNRPISDIRGRQITAAKRAFRVKKGHRILFDQIPRVVKLDEAYFWAALTGAELDLLMLESAGASACSSSARMRRR